MKTFTLPTKKVGLRSICGFICWRQFVSNLLIAVTVLFSFSLTAQNIQGTVPVQVPTGGFGIDGDAYANIIRETGITNNVGDWFYDPILFPGSGGGLFNPDGSVLDDTRTFFLQDDWGTFDGTTFTGSSKINDNPISYTWGPANNLLAKNDMQNIGAHFAFSGPNETGDLWCMFAADRQVVNGDAYIDFEFLQKPMMMTGATYDANGDLIGGSGTFTTEGTDDGRTLNDLLVTLIFTGGGDQATVEIRRWQPGKKGFEYVLIPNPDIEYAGKIFATNNNASTTVPFNVYGTNPGTYLPNQWAEGAVNLSALFDVEVNPCTQISTVFVRTKTSQSPTAELKDFPGGIIQLNISFKPDIDPLDDVTQCSDEPPYVLPEITGTKLTGNQAYYTEPDGGGTIIPVGTLITESQTIYIYDAIVPGDPDCLDEESFKVTIYPVTDTYTDSYTVCEGEEWTFSYDPDGNGLMQYGPYTFADGTMIVPVTDANGCPYNLEFTVNEFPVTDTYTDSYTVCEGEEWTFSYDPDGNGLMQYGPYTFADGTMIVPVTDANGCPYNLEFTVNEFPVTDTYTDSYTVCEGEEWTFSYDPDGNGLMQYGPYTFADGTMIVPVTDANGCPYNLEFTVNEFPVTDTYTDSYTVCEGEEWTFSYDPDGNGLMQYGPYTFADGTMIVPVTDANGCPYNLEFTVNEFPVTDTYTDSYTVCEGEEWTFSYDPDGNGLMQYGPYTFADGTMIVPVTDANGCPYNLEFTVNEFPVTDTYTDSYTVCEGEEWTFSYDPDGNGLMQYGPYTFADGTMIVPVTDANGCPYNLEFTVNEFPVTDTYTDSYTVCEGEEWTFSYDPDGNGLMQYGPYTFADGTMIVPVTDANGCPYNLEFTVNEFPVTDTYTDSYTVCEGEEWTFSYDPDGNGLMQYGPYTFADGTMIVPVTDANGCPYNLEFTVNEFPVTDTYTDSYTVCEGEEWTFSYDPDGNGLMQYGPYTFADGTMIVPVTDANGCPYNLEFTVNEFPVTDTYTDSYTVCEGEEWTFSYDPDGNGLMQYGPYTFADGTMIVPVTDANGCPYNLEFTVNEFPVTDTYTDSFTVCEGESHTFSYDPDGNGLMQYGPYTFADGTMIVPVTDANGCPYNLEFTVNEFPVTDTYTDSYTVCEGEEWTFSYDPDGNGLMQYGPYTFADGTMIVPVTDANGCPYNLEFTVNEFPVTDTYTDSFTVCEGESHTFSYDPDGNGLMQYGPYTFADGTMIVPVTDANGCPYNLEFTVNEFPVTDTYTDSYTVCEGEEWTFSYDPDGNGLMQYGPYTFADGTMIVPVTDANGCPYNLEFTVNEFPVTDTYTDSYTVCEGEEWTFSYDPDGNGLMQYGPYTFADGTMIVPVTDANGCPYNLEFTVNEFPVTDTYTDSYTVCEGEEWTFSYDPDGNGLMQYGPYTFADGTMIVPVTDANGCPYNLEFTVNEFPVTDTYTDSFTVCEGESHTFSYDPDGNGLMQYGPYTFADGTMIVPVTDANGCPYNLEFTVNEFPVTDTYTDSFTVCEGESHTFSYDPDGNGLMQYGPYTFADGTMIVPVTDANGCPYNLEFTVNEFPVTDTYTDSFTVCEGESHTFSYDPDGNGLMQYGPYTFADGTMIVPVTDANGCPYNLEFTVNEDPNPILVINNPETVCDGETVDITLATVTEGSTLYGATLSYWEDELAEDVVVVNPGAVGAGTYYIKAETTSGCIDIEPVVVTTEPCANYCSYTQGFYGNEGGLGCAPELEEQVNAQTMMIMALNNVGGLIYFGDFDAGNFFELTLADVSGDDAQIFTWLPGGGAPAALVGEPTYNKKIKNNLLAQTITLFFNIELNSAIGDWTLLSEFYTSESKECGGDEGYYMTETFNIDQAVIDFLNINYGDATVSTLFELANVALGGGYIGGLNPSMINDAVDNINMGFDECRILRSEPNSDEDAYPDSVDCDDHNPMVNPGMTEEPYNGLDDDCNPLTLDDDLDEDGYPLAEDCDDNDPEVNPGMTEVLDNDKDDDCDPLTLDTPEVVAEPLTIVDVKTVDFKAYPVPFVDNLTVQYEYEYDTDVNIQVFDTKGLLISSETDTEYIKGEIGSKNLDLSRVADQALIIRVISNKEVMSKMVIAKSVKKRF